MSYAAIIVAAGRGTRAGGNVAKQWQPLAGARVIDHTLKAFQRQALISQIILVLHPDELAKGEGFKAQGLTIVAGGETRAASVQAGLAVVTTDKVLIHDAARPCVPDIVIADVIEAMKDFAGAAPGVPVTDTLWRRDEAYVDGVQDRDNLFAAQTPQAFDVAKLRAAYASFDRVATDDVSVAVAAGLSVVITAGHPDNIKITRPQDFARAARILEAQMDIRTGNGFDVHAFGPGDHVMLCGVKIPHDFALVGHSDADVGLHTITDAIYGALAEGDIGTHFPPSDPQWKGAESHIFLRHAAQLAAQKGYKITHVDCTLICEQPKVGPHAKAMRASVAEMIGIETDRVSVKATTSERLGFTGRGEGIACMATATLVKP